MPSLENLVEIANPQQPHCPTVLLLDTSGSMYANEVAPLTSGDWARTLRISEVLHGVRGLLAFTDGCQRAALRKNRDGYAPFAGFCESLLTYAAGVHDAGAAVRDLEELLRSVKLAGHSEDDKTLVLAVVHTPGEGHLATPAREQS
jgi:hypothetical protein